VEVPVNGATQARVLRERSRQYFDGSSSQSLLRLLVPRNEAVRIDITPAPPLLPTVLRAQRFAQDQRLSVDFETGVALNLDLRDALGHPQELLVAVTAGGGFHSVQEVEAGEAVAVPRGRETIIEAAPRSGATWVRHKGRFDASGSLSLQLAEEAQLSGRVLGGDDSPQSPVRVQALQAGMVVASDISDADGRYSLRLPAGDYALRAFFEGLSAPVASATPRSIQLAAGPRELDLGLPRPDTTLQLQVPPSCHGAYFYRVPITLVDAEGQVAVRHGSLQSGQASTAYKVAAGRYTLRAEVPGYPLWEAEIEVAASGTTNVQVQAAEDACRVWRGQLLDAEGVPVAQRNLRFDDAAQEIIGWARSDAEGRFALPISAGYSYELPAPEAGRSLRSVRVIERRRASFDEDLQLQSLDFAELPQPRPGRQLIYGDADDPQRFDIVFVAEGYVAEQEPFTDRNGNGLWDGVLFADLNRNGVWEQGEPYSVYGNAPTPQPAQAGTDIGSDNEPFEDRNGDGYPNIDDPGVFGLNVRNFVRELLSLPFWSERRDAINAWALWYGSEQAGMDLIDREGEPIAERRTAFGARWLQDRSLLSIDYARVDAALATDFPHHGQRVVMLNQPVAMGRANSYILYYGGLPGASPNSTVASHELGHSLGLLADEYQEFRGNHLGVEPAAPNLTRFLEADLPRWRITAAGAGPHALGQAGSGWFEGGGYYQGGIYRPSHQSKMRSNRLRFNPVSLQSLAHESCARLGACEAYPVLRSGVWWNPSEPGWGLFAVDQGDVLAVAWFTYAEDGRPSWFLLPATAQADGDYRAPVLRFSGTPLAEIGPGSRADEQIAGEATLRFSPEGGLAFDYRVGSSERSVLLDPFPFADPTPRCVPHGTVRAEDSEQVSDVWWNPAESGWGLFLSQRGNQLFAAWYTYAEDGSPLFLIATAEGDGETFRGPVFQQRNGTPYAQIDGQPASPGADAVGEVELHFDSGRSGRFRYTLGSLQQDKPIERLQAGSVAPICGDR
jgi:hypothetical protein